MEGFVSHLKEREVRALLKGSKELKCTNLIVLTGDYESEEVIWDLVEDSQELDEETKREIAQARQEIRGYQVERKSHWEFRCALDSSCPAGMIGTLIVIL